MSLKEIKLDRVYLSGGRFYRPIGWLGENSLVYEEVTVHQTNRGFHFYWVARKVRGRRVYQETLDRFSKDYREPSPEDLRRHEKL